MQAWKFSWNFSKNDKLVDELKNTSDNITEKEAMQKIVRTLTSRFNYITPKQQF